MRLILVRHGESLHSQRRLIAGERGCLGLTEQGRAQAHALAERLRRAGASGDGVALLSSPVPRARETAAILAETLALPAPDIAPGLAELLPGDADGLVWHEYVERHGAFDLQAEPERPFAPNGESWNAFTARVQAEHRRLAREYAGRTVLAVTHGGFVVMSLLAMFGIPRPGTGARIDPAFTSLTEWSVNDGVWRLERYNDVAHLAVL
jgi:probable phosphoglycerate mutase